MNEHEHQCKMMSTEEYPPKKNAIAPRGRLVLPIKTILLQKLDAIDLSRLQ